jgi:hypothetical protein
MQPDASAGLSDAPPTSGEDAATTTETSDALSGDATTDAGAVEVDTGMTNDAACTPITITFDASGYPPIGQCCTSASDCEVDAGLYAGVLCGDTTATLQPCCLMSHCTIVPNHTQ